MNKNINPYKNIYITNNKNIFFNFQNPNNNKIANNEIVHKKINSQMNFNNNIKSLHSRKITDFNINNEIKNSINVGKNFNKILNILNNDNYKKIKYTLIYANEPINYNLCNSYDNFLSYKKLNFFEFNKLNR